MQDFVLVYLLHSFDDLREDQKILTPIDDAAITASRDETVTFFGVSRLQELLEGLAGAVLHLDHYVDRVALLVRLQKVVQCGLREASSIITA